MAANRRILSGMQPTGHLHLGNYLGALRNWVRLQDEAECFYCIVDLHAITMPQDPKELRAAIRNTAAAYIAAGIDPERSTLFAQSSVPQHCELSWIFNTITPLGWLARITQFKEKATIKFRPDISEEEQQQIGQDIAKIAIKENAKLKFNPDVPDARQKRGQEAIE